MNIRIENNINFGSIKLFKAQLIKENILGEKKPLKAYISLLEKSDLNRLDMQEENWLDEYGNHTIGTDIIRDMTRSKNTSEWNNCYFFGVECPEEPKGSKIKAIAEIIKCNKNIKLYLLQSKTPFENYSEKTHGAGSCLIYVLTKIAQIMNKNKIKVTSLDDNSTAFYKKFGFVQDRKSNYEMNEETIPQAQKILEEKYKISPVRIKTHFLV